MPCELIDKNGEVLKNILLQYCTLWKLPGDFIQWLTKNNTFCNSLVDRIVPGFPKENIAELQEATGFEDHRAVSAEPFYLWVIEAPSFVQQLFPTAKAGLSVKYVSDLTPYATRKVRILNGAHTTMVPVAYLRGLRTVNGAMSGCRAPRASCSGCGGWSTNWPRSPNQPRPPGRPRSAPMRTACARPPMARWTRYRPGSKGCISTSASPISASSPTRWPSLLGKDGKPGPDTAWAVREAATILVQLVSPMMPHLAEECWQVLGQSGLISEADWPQIERDLLVEDTVTLVVQVNGKKRGDVTVPRVAQNPEIEAAVLALDAVKVALGGKAVRKVIVVPMRIVNVVG